MRETGGPGFESHRRDYDIVFGLSHIVENILLMLDMNIVGCRLSDLKVKCSRARVIGPEFEAQET